MLVCTCACVVAGGVFESKRGKAEGLPVLVLLSLEL